MMMKCSKFCWNKNVFKNYFVSRSNKTTKLFRNEEDKMVSLLSVYCLNLTMPWVKPSSSLVRPLSLGCMSSSLWRHHSVLSGVLTSLGWPRVIRQVTRGTELHCLLGSRLGTSRVTGRQTFLGVRSHTSSGTSCSTSVVFS